MASLFQKLLKKPSSNVIITTLAKQPLPNLAPQLLTRLRDDPSITNFTPSKTGDPIPPVPIPIFPSFPYAFFLSPIYSTEFVPSDADDGGSDEGLWADSVKKKRKRKMNKHKLKKLRKRLRKKT